MKELFEAPISRCSILVTGVTNDEFLVFCTVPSYGLQPILRLWIAADVCHEYPSYLAALTPKVIADASFCSCIGTIGV